MFLIHAIVRFLFQALALKLSVEVVRAPGVQNHYRQALRVSALLGLLSIMCGMIPVVGWLLYLVMWCVVVMRTYKLSLVRGMSVAVLQSLIAFGLLKLLVIFDLLPASATL